MIGLIGDVHGDLRALQQLVYKAKDVGASLVIQVGDLGFWPQTIDRYRDQLALPLPVYAIDGNHEYFPMLAGMSEITEVLPDLHYVPRGSVVYMDGRWIGFLGGAGSIDKHWRKPGIDWFPQEQITDADCAQLLAEAAGKKLDLLVTHVPPQRTIIDEFEKDPWDKVRMFEVPVNWKDPSADQVERVWVELGNPPLYCGHMHRSVTHGGLHKVRILDINELLLV